METYITTWKIFNFKNKPCQIKMNKLNKKTEVKKRKPVQALIFVKKSIKAMWGRMNNVNTQFGRRYIK